MRSASFLKKKVYFTYIYLYFLLKIFVEFFFFSLGNTLVPLQSQIFVLGLQSH